MSEERDKFLTEAMGICVHEFTTAPMFHTAVCGWCHQTVNVVKYSPIDFSTWEGFGKLWEWSQKQEWCIAFKASLVCIGTWDGTTNFSLGNYYIHPDRFADAVYAYLKEEVPYEKTQHFINHGIQ